MQTITLSARVDETRRLVIDLPADLLASTTELVIRSISAEEPANGDTTLREKRELTREGARAKLIAAGLVSPHEKSPDALEISQEELERLRNLFAGERPLSELIDEDRKDRV
jgi:hypothetical protein